ncbi:MerR family transcriptional regulator [Butyrivibrio proteoclasticus]|uniref:MerR family transcriptional regulator n=1 Tax=Butyrivibrio proteoclasticus TaxID=43305 RepID=UPI00047CCE91|nr:MerR family transcriptional regulator [Butyrivibrio proteoclasticus]
MNEDIIMNNNENIFAGNSIFSSNEEGKICKEAAGDSRADNIDPQSPLYDGATPATDNKNQKEYNPTSFAESFMKDFDFFSSTEMIEEPEVIPSTESEILYSTFDIANELGITPQTIRNYTGYFKDFLNVEKNDRGIALYTIEDLETLRLIFSLKHNKKYDKEKIRIYLENDGKMPPLGDSNTAKKVKREQTSLSKDAMLKFADYIEKLFESNFNKFESSFSDKVENVGSLINGMDATIKEQADIIEKQRAELEKQRDLINGVKSMTKQSKDAIEQIKQTQDDNADKTDEALKNTESALLKAISNITMPEIKLPDIDLESVKEDIKKDIDSKTRATANELKDKLNKQQQTIGNLDAKLSKIAENTDAKDTQNDANESINRVKDQLSSKIDKTNSDITKTIKKDNAELLKKIDEKLENMSNSTLQDPEPQDQQELELLKKELDDIKEKFKISQIIISKLEEENSVLSNKLSLSTELINRLNTPAGDYEEAAKPVAKKIQVEIPQNDEYDDYEDEYEEDTDMEEFTDMFDLLDENEPSLVK